MIFKFHKKNKIATLNILLIGTIITIVIIMLGRYFTRQREGLTGCPTGCTASTNITGSASNIFPNKAGDNKVQGCFRDVFQVCDPKTSYDCTINKDPLDCSRNNMCRLDSDCTNCLSTRIGVDCSRNNMDPGFDQGCPTGYGIKYCPSYKYIVGTPSQSLPLDILSYYGTNCYALGQTCTSTKPNDDLISTPTDITQPDKCIPGYYNCGDNYFPKCQKVSSKTECKGMNAGLKCALGSIWDNVQKMCVYSSGNQRPSSQQSVNPFGSLQSGPSPLTGSGQTQDGQTGMIAYDSVWDLF